MVPVTVISSDYFVPENREVVLADPGPGTEIGTSLLKNSMAELDEEEKHRKSSSYETFSQHFSSKTRYFASLKTHQLTFSTGWGHYGYFQIVLFQLIDMRIIAILARIGSRRLIEVEAIGNCAKFSHSID